MSVAESAPVSHTEPSPRSQATPHSAIHYRPDIDGLRTIAVVPVVLFHAGFSWIPGGYVGVDIFFVISGYLITSILVREIDRGDYSLLRFYERRARRILPALFTVLVATFLGASLVLFPTALADLAKSALATLSFLSNVWFWKVTSDYFGPGADLMPLLHTWSLAVEEQFYIVFPVFLWLVLPHVGKRATIWITAGLCLVSLVWASWLVIQAPSSAFYLPFSRAWELGIGSLLALGVVPDLSRRWLRELVSGLGLAMLIVVNLIYSNETVFPGLSALAPCLGAAMLIAAGGQGPSLASRVLAIRPMVFIGLISYSLYLWHWPFIVLPRHFFGELELALPVQLTVVALSFVAGWLSWRFVERPFRSQPPQGFSRNQIFAFSGAGIALLAVMAVGIVKFDGLPGRFGPAVQGALAAAEDRNPARAACFGARPFAQLCEFGTPSADGKRDVLLWGDSHADAIMPGVATALEADGLTGVFASQNACTPLLGVNRVDLNRSTVCSEFNDAVMAGLQGSDDLGTVILMGRWALTAEGERPAHEAGRPALLSGPQTEATTPDQNFAIFDASLRRTVAAIRATGREVILMGTVPEIGWNVPSHMALAYRWGHTPPEHPTLDSARARNARVAALFEDIAAEDPGVRLVDLSSGLCRPDCVTDVDGQLIYFDDDHLNAYGARMFVAPRLAPVLRAD